ncbi:MULTISPECIES: response regulator transcription factor [unclassified Chryseobacterium]|uniref:response regulator transcription factor n=1 Tax=unclassified Chryseobacterium TaxID=2593645 RepID=UPI002853623A|nr:response regulator transcription factor [Chryseobacterium sp. CFS7]MDR4890637.1 response regulator transcription factor [Chryseobacterium sp. CFS7]
MKILVIEDEAALSKSIITYLGQENYLCEVAPNINTAVEKIDSYDYDCILLDISLPDGNGLSVLKILKEDHKTDGVIIISAKDSIDDKIAGLQLGADDYIPKPFHLSELSARIAAVIRRRRFNGDNILVFHEITIDTLAKTVTANNQKVDLTKTEYDLLLYFTINKNRVLSKTAIAEHLSGENADVYDNYDFIYAHIKNMKKKLTAVGCNDYLKSIYGMGYKFEY